MTSVRIIWLLLCLLWIAAEISLARKTRLDSQSMSENEERSQWVLWITVVVSLIIAMIFKTFAWSPIPIQYLPRQLVALMLFVAGLYFRYAAVGRLGRFFTTNVSIQDEHVLIIDGPYRWVRHPAYTGLLMALVAAGIAMGDLLALMLLTVPSFFAFKYRIGIEERMLNKKFGTSYHDYSKTTTKLLPWLF
jgi:protein-S-isoprenylcysteine O-methyltransferase Ste14